MGALFQYGRVEAWFVQNLVAASHINHGCMKKQACPRSSEVSVRFSKKDIRVLCPPSFLPSSLSTLPSEFESFPRKLASPTADVEIVRPFDTNSMFVPNGDWTLDNLPVFLSHAHLYVFSDQYDVRDLQRLAARRLDEALQQFEFESPCATDFALLLQYIYNHTPDRELKADVLRTVKGFFVARNIEPLMKSENFKSLIEDGGELALDVLSKSVERL